MPYKHHPGRVTINDLADALGLAKGTVSRALNEYPDIAERTRLRVKRAAQEMGYSPLSHAQAIKTGRVRSLGLVLQIDQRLGHRPFLTRFLDGISRAASAQGWTLTLATALSEGEALETIERLAHERKADGFILPRTKVDDPRVALLRNLNLPCVLYGRTSDDEGCFWFDMLGEDAMFDAVSRLAGMGHSRIGYVGSDQVFNYAHLRHDGYRRGLESAGLSYDAALVRHGAMTGEEGAACLQDILSDPEPPTAVVFCTDAPAIGAYRTCAELGLEIGRDISLIGYDGLPEGSYAHPSLTTFSVDSRMAGERLADLLIRRIRGADPKDLRETAKAKLVTGGSDGPPAKTSTELARAVRAKHNTWEEVV